MKKLIKKLQDTFALTETGAQGLIKASIGAFFAQISYMFPVMLVMFFVDGVLNNKLKSPGFFISTTLLVGLVMYVIIYINYNLLYTETYRESANLRIDIANRLKELPLSYFSNHDISDLSQTVMSDVERIEHAMSHSIPQVFGFSIYFLIIGSLMLINDFKLGMAVITPVLISFFLIRLSKRIQINSTTEYYNQLRVNSESFQETIELQQEIKIFGLDKDVKEKLYKQMDYSEKLHLITEIKEVSPILLSSIILKFTLGLTIFFGTRLLINQETSLLYLIGYVLASAKIIGGIEVMNENLGEILYINSRVNRINKIRYAETQKGQPRNIESFDIELKDVSFSYKDSQTIDRVSFTAKQNEVTAIIGPSGCGKSTLLKLMSRLYDYDQGQILIDGLDIKAIDTDSLFKNISIVFQDVSLFNTSILENIRIGNMDASDEEVLLASKLAGCDDFVEKLPEGYNSLIGENGAKLSGGERQRLSIARAFLKDAPIVLLDEISASLDVENEMKIQDSLNKLIENKTVVIISHRLKSIENADKIVVLNKGKVDSIGKHKELLKDSKLYKNLIEKSNITENYTY